ncbi:MAG: hypothetical protein N2200_07970 [Bacteroidia bacterium]|nr:hypothetical protein [Bacteroidia bacterium]MDW8417482.1 hypothetical protein [Bacteroidia bacterium]
MRRRIFSQNVYLSLCLFSLLTLGSAIVTGCASIQPPDGGPADYASPTLRKVKVSRNKRHLRLRWNEYLSPTSQLERIGIWVNPYLPLRLSFRGKVVRVWIDSLPSDGQCIFLWGGPGIKDFTEGNPLPPTLLWSTCPEETLFVGIPLLDSKESSLIHGELRRSGDIYHFVAWKSILYVGSLPAGTYTGWAWEDKNPDGKWSIDERIWLPNTEVVIPASDSLLPDTMPANQQVFSPLTRKFLPEWHPWEADTLPPATPRIQLLDTVSALLYYSEPVYPKGASAFPLSEKILLVPQNGQVIVADSLGLWDTLILQKGQIDTQTYKPAIFWHAQANARTPYLHLRWGDTLFAPDTFWVGKKQDSLYIGRASFLAREVWLEPLPTEGEVESFLHSSRGDTLKIKLPARKHRVVLPVDSLVRKWRIYLPTRYGSGSYIEAPGGDTLWLPAGTYEMIGLSHDDAFWRPVEIQRDFPVLRMPPAITRRSLRVEGLSP